MAAADLFLRAMDIIGTTLLWTWWIFLIGGLFIAKKRAERWPIDAIIIEKRGDNLIKTNERAGRFFDKETQVSKYILKKSKDTIPVYNFEWMLHNADKPLGILERITMFIRPTIGTIFLFRYGSKQYKPINIKQAKTEKQLKLVEVKNREGEPLFQYSYNQFDPRWVLGVLDFEVVDWDNMNFMVQEQRASIMRRAKGGDWWKQALIPVAIIAGSLVAAIFILKFSADTGADLRAAGGAAPAPQPQQSGGVIGGAINEAVTPGG
jgi:hypothetical protein